MARLKTQAAKESLLRRMRKQRLNYIAILPSLITILNAVFGFSSIVLASEGNFTLASYMLLLAMVADMLDGRVARMSKSTSSFGGQLDSLCDVISFGIAPAFIAFKIIVYKLQGLTMISPTTEELIERFIWLACIAFVSCAAIRLARFNVENEEDETAHMSFSGLPTPAAAGTVASLIIFHQEALKKMLITNGRLYNFFEDGIIYILPFVLLGTAILMVSRIKYPHILNQYIKGKKPFAYLIRALVFLGVIIWSRQVALVLIFCGFALSGVIRWLYYRFAHKVAPASDAYPPKLSADQNHRTDITSGQI
jgi:CDP-diacylglycerol---serine O-phosphatidyltransferase